MPYCGIVLFIMSLAAEIAPPNWDSIQEPDSFTLVTEMLRRLSGSNPTYTSEIHIPLLGSQMCVACPSSTDPAIQKNHGYTSKLVAVRAPTLITVQLTDTKLPDEEPVRLHAPLFNRVIPVLPLAQMFDGFELTIRQNGDHQLHGINAGEVVDIDGLQPIHAARFASGFRRGLAKRA